MRRGLGDCWPLIPWRVEAAADQVEIHRASRKAQKRWKGSPGKVIEAGGGQDRRAEQVKVGLWWSRRSMPMYRR